MKTKFLPTTMLLLATTAITAPAYAQSAVPKADNVTASENGVVPEIIVTAQKHSESLQKSAVSITVRKGQDLAKQGRNSIQQILEDVPGISYVPLQAALGPTAGNTIVIRGLITDQLDGAGIDPPSTAVYVDGVYEGIGGTYDIDRVEVLRGPQGTLFGRSATAGVVSINTVAPKLGIVTADLSAEAASYNLTHFQGGLNIPLGDMLAVRFSGSDLAQDGYDSVQGGHRHISDGRVKLLFKPAANLDMTLAYSLQKATGNLGGVQFDNTPTGIITSSFPITPSTSLAHQVNGNINWNFGPATLTYIGSYQDYRNTQVNDIVAGPPGAAPIESDVNIPFDHTSSHELHVASNPESKLTWIAGLIYYYNNVQQTNRTFSTASGANLFADTLTKQTKDLGAFAQLTYPVTDTTRLTGGLRYDKTKVQVTEPYSLNLTAANGFFPPFVPFFGLPEVDGTLTLSGAAGYREFNTVTFKARIEHDLTSTSMVYGLVSTGFLPGDVRVTTTTVSSGGTVTGSKPIASPYDQQTLTSFEVGTKNRFLHNALQVNASFYYNKYTNYQISTNVSTAFSPNYQILQSPARMWGFDLDALYMLTRDDRLSVTAGYTNAEFVNQPTAAPYPFQTYIVRNAIPGIAPWTISPTYTHTFRFGNDFKLEGRIAGLYTSAFNVIPLSVTQLSAESLAHIPGHITGNLDVTLSYNQFSLTGYVRNFTNKRYINSTGGFGNVSSTDVTVGLTNPLTAGVVLKVHF